MGNICGGTKKPAKSGKSPVAKGPASKTLKNKKGFYDIVDEAKSLNDQNFEKLRKAAAGKKFKDTAFLPVLSSITKNAKLPARYEEKDLCWKRLSELYAGKDCDLLIQREDENFVPDIKSGYKQRGSMFKTALFALSFKPQRVRNLFTVQEKTEEGIYSVKMNKNGIPVEVVVDDLVPFMKSEPLAMTSTANELWVPLIEKAYAKMYGDYFDSKNNSSLNVIRDITGATGRTFEIADNSEDIFEKLKECYEKEWFATVQAGTVEGMEDLGLEQNLSYTFERVAEVEADGEVHKLVMLLNPDGYLEWTGDWNENSDNWTDELREQHNIYATTDGSFWMTLEDFTKYFSEIHISYYYDDFQLSYTTHKGHWGAHLVEIPEDGTYNFSFQQASKEMVGEGSYEYSEQQMVLVRVYDSAEGVFTCYADPHENVKVINGSMNEDFSSRECHLETELEAGQYLLFTEINKDDPKSFKKVDQSYTITCYSKDQVVFENMTAKLQKNKILKIIARAIFEGSSAVEYNINPSEGLSEEVVGEFTDCVTNFNYHFFYIKNDEPQTLVSSLHFSGGSSAQLVDTFENKDGEFTVNVKAESVHCICYNIANNDVNYSEEVTTQYTDEPVEESGDKDPEQVDEEDQEDEEVKVDVGALHEQAQENGEIQERLENIWASELLTDDEFWVFFDNKTEDTILHETIYWLPEKECNLRAVAPNKANKVTRDVIPMEDSYYSMSMKRIDPELPISNPIKSRKFRFSK